MRDFLNQDLFLSILILAAILSVLIYMAKKTEHITYAPPLTKITHILSSMKQIQVIIISKDISKFFPFLCPDQALNLLEGLFAGPLGLGAYRQITLNL